MPADDRTLKGAERCDLHPGNPAVASCDGCGRPLCLACAVPVRGQAFGAECLAAALGTPGEPPPGAGAPEPSKPGTAVATTAFAVAALASLLPWSRFGAGSGALGAWSRSPRWSTIAAIAAVAGLSLCLSRRLGPFGSRGWDLVRGIFGIVVFVASLLYLARPPDFSDPWLGPWVAAVAGAVAAAGSFRLTRGARQPERAHI